MSDDKQIVTFGPAGEGDRRQQFIHLMRECPVPDRELLLNMGLFLTPQNLSRILFFDFLYKQILDVQGVVMEFGCRWGQSLSLFTALRGIYEPFNRLRTVVGFDTFSGFAEVTDEDGAQMKQGAYATSAGYADYLEQLLAFQEQESPMSHLRKFEVVRGDVIETLPPYLERNPHTVIALAYFDLDLYKPTKFVLEQIRDRITRGTVLGFDEACDASTPGETLALMKVLGLRNVALKRFPHNARTSYLVVE
jgi:hypothetical protein